MGSQSPVTQAGIGRPQATASDLLAHLARGEPLPVYALLGIDPLGRSVATAALSQAALGPEARERWVSRYQGDAVADAAELYARLREQGAAGSRRLVFVANAQTLLDADRAAFLGYVADPPARPVLVLVLNVPPGDLEVASAIARVGMLAWCTRPTDADLAGWAGYLARRRGAAIEAAAAARLVEYAGPHLYVLEDAVLRVLGDSITEGDIESIAGDLPIAAILELTAHALRKHRRTASQILEHLLDEGRDNRYILRSVRRVLEDLVRVRELLDTGTLDGAIAEAMGRKPGHYLDQLLAQVRCRSKAELRRSLDLLDKARRDAENGGETLERLLSRLCRHSVERSWPYRALHLWIAAVAHR